MPTSLSTIPSSQTRLDTGSSGTLKNTDLLAEGFNQSDDNLLKCSSCGLPVKPSQFSTRAQLRDYHASEKPDCTIAKHPSEAGAFGHIDLKPSQMLAESPESPTSSQSLGRFVECKGFHTFDSLRYERERLATFVDWPLHWLSKESLAKEGFYYLRDHDYCSCVFCRGIVGSWEPGDIPQQEHQRHFPKCPFVKGQPVGNVPLQQGDLLASLPAEGPFVTPGKLNLFIILVLYVMLICSYKHGYFFLFIIECPSLF